MTKRQIVSSDMSAMQPAKYRDLSNDSLLCYAVSQLISQSTPVTFENITVAAFRLFPEHFSLVGYPEYPDASRVNRTLLHARPKYRDLIVGSATNGYALTKKGESVARQIEVELKSQGATPQSEQVAAVSHKRTYTGHRVVQQIESSPLYKHWGDSDWASVGDYEVWDFLEAMPYTDKRVLRDIMKNYREAAELSGRQDISRFLSWVAKEYKHVFQEGEVE